MVLSILDVFHRVVGAAGDLAPGLEALRGSFRLPAV